MTEQRLREALERVTNNFRWLLAGKPVRDVSETLAEADSALAAPIAAPADERFPVEIRMNDGALDEVVSPYFHLEQMDSHHWWMAVYDSRDATRRVTVNFHAKGKIKAFVDREGAMATPAGSKPE